MRTFAEKPKVSRQAMSSKTTVPDRSRLGHSHEMQSILPLGRTIGNQAVQRLLQSNAEERNPQLTGTASSHFGHDFSLSSVTAGPIQTKLAINRPGDEYEKEADRVADQVMRMPEAKLQRVCACGGACPKCKAEQPPNAEPKAKPPDAKQTPQQPNPIWQTLATGRVIQTKLFVSQPDDPYEREADRVADQVMRMPNPINSQKAAGGSRQSVPQIQRICSDCEEEEAKRQAVVPQIQRKSGPCAEEEIQRRMSEEDEEDEPIQRKTADGEANGVDPDFERGLSAIRDGGQPLPASARSFFEPRFGRSFSDVRIHTGEAAHQAARSVNAKAFTLRNNIAFARGEYEPSSDSGRRLMAHELTHTVQQSGAAESVQRGGAGIFGGKGCLRAAGVEWALVGAGVWKRLAQGDCTGTLEDADGMTCGGGFYRVDNGQTGSCSNPRHDDATFAPRRWTPTLAAASATSPTQEGSTAGDTPPGYVYDAAGTVTYPGCTTAQDTTVESARTTALSKSNAAAAAMTALKGGTGTAPQQAALTAHFNALSAAQFDTAKNRYDAISNRLRTPSLFACGSAPAQAYCGPPDNWCAGTVCPTTTGISYICPGAFVPNCAEPNLWSVLLHEAGRAAGCCPPDVMSTDAGYPPAAPACLTNVYCYSGFARAI